MNNLFANVAVLMGGGKSEREVSLRSGNAVVEALQQEGIKCEGIDVEDNYIDKLHSNNYSCVFIALHGGFGENGTVQGLLECMGIPYTGSGVLASALSMDKVKAKNIWQDSGLPVLPTYDYHNIISSNRDEVFPLVVKPIFEGSSVGVYRANNMDELTIAYNDASKFGPVMLEPWVTGEDVTVSILGQQSLPTIRIKPTTSFYDYKAKYQANDTVYTCPALPDVLESQVQELALQAYDALGCSGWGRVDFMQDSNGGFWLLEVNTVPGLTTTSLVPKAAKQSGISFNDLIIAIINNAKCDHLEAFENSNRTESASS